MIKTPPRLGQSLGLYLQPSQVLVYDQRSRIRLGAWPDLAQAQQALQARRGRWWRGDAMDVLISDAYCRYLVLPRPQGVRNASELSAVLRGRFQAVFGADRWTLRQATAPLGDLDFVVGADQQLLDELKRFSRSSGWRLRSVRPHWLAWAEQWRSHTRKGAHWLIASDGESGAIGYVRDGNCHLARSIRVTPGLSVRAALARESAFIAEADPGARVWLAGHGLLPDGTPSAHPIHAASGGALWGAQEVSA
ncbi:hypothetical protein [Paucibacter sp. XJ19-41]|uniref:hypothetical protein n=1 Tax=Paucibacter sp. XJ19-41 TaxID=2927824 RepID=UPI002349E26B|nr:hypothetical protein [Paucibacter sp. XJ19-41]MDC6167887.1 hypothetical protein [Paucibacter sp. XJ19-41]